MVAADELAAVAVAHHTEHYTEDNHVDFNHDVNDDDNDNVERDETAMQVQLGFIKCHHLSSFIIMYFTFDVSKSFSPSNDRTFRFLIVHYQRNMSRRIFSLMGYSSKGE